MNKWQEQKEYEERIDLKNQLKRIQCGADPNYLHSLDFKNQKSVLDQLYQICDNQGYITTDRLRKFLDKLGGDR